MGSEQRKKGESILPPFKSYVVGAFGLAVVLFLVLN